MLITEKRGRLAVVLGVEEVIYRDVPVDQWFALYVSALVEEGVAQGYRDSEGKLTGEYGVGNPVTRAEVLKMAMEAAEEDMTAAVPPPRNASTQGSWASSYVAIAERDGISLFAAEVNVHAPATRAEVVQIILEVMGVPTDIKIPSPFSDVSDEHPHPKAVITASEFGLVEGDTTPDGAARGTFRPDDFINRAEVSKIVALVRGLVR